MQTVSFLIEEAKKDRIDLLASQRDMDRNYIINEALDAYLDLMDWQRRHIEEGKRQADAEYFASEDEITLHASRKYP